MDFKDYYATLGVPKTATEADIRKAYRKLARKHHPDLNQGDKAAEAKFKEVNEANEVLGNPDTRRKYDELGANWRDQPQVPPGGTPFGGSRTMTQEEFQATFGGGAGGSGGPGSPGSNDPFSDFFHAFFGGQGDPRARRDTRPSRGRDVEQAVSLTLEEAFAGATRRVTVNQAGKTRTVDIRIPAGVRDGARVRAAGEGASGPGGSAAGDLFLVVHIEPHARFERRDQDVYVRVPISVTTAVLGGDVAVPALSGSTLRLKVPELTTSGQVFRLRGHGLPAVGKPDVRGDVYATVTITAPPKLSAEARAHYAALKALEEEPS